MRVRCRRLGFLFVLGAATVARAGAARAASFQASLDRDAVAPGEPFGYEVRLTAADENVEGYRPPDFHGLEVLSAPRYPSRSTNMQIGGGQTSIQNGYTWSYELRVPAGAKTAPSIGAAHVKLGGRDLASNVVPLRLGAGGAPPRRASGPPAGLGPGGMFQHLFGGSAFDNEPREAPEALASSNSAFVRAVPDKTRAFVGEQVTVSWYLYLTQSQNKYETLTEPRTDGFWTEDIPSTNPQGRLAFSEQTLGGRTYNVALLFKKALFPLQAGRLTITPMEAEVAQVDFFGTPMRTKRLKTDPLVIEAMALPREGQPPHFDAANVGRYRVSAAVDRSAVSVGDAVTLKVAVTGTGNVRNVEPPALPALDGWKTYEPKTDVVVDGSDTITGTKTVEWLMRPERAGQTRFPPLTLETFDPASKHYVAARSQPIEITVSGEAGAPVAAGSGAPSPPSGVDNVIAGSIRPIRVHARPRGEAGVAFLHGAGFAATVVTPPLALAVLALYGRARQRLGRDSRRNRRRRVRSLARRRLRAAQAHRAAGRVAAFYVEIDRVLREALSERLGAAVGGLRLDELRELLAARQLPTAEVDALVATLEACDEARFSGGAAAAPDALAATLARAEELIDAIERAPLGEEARA